MSRPVRGGVGTVTKGVGTVTRGVGTVAKTGARTVGKGLGTAAKATAQVAKQIDRVPVVGRPLSLVYGATVSAPLDLANRVAHGARIDKAAIGHLRAQLSRAKQLAPYAQAVVTLVPGVGQGVGAAIGAGVALADGKPLSQAVVAGIRGALPGGPAGQAAFELGRAALSGKKLDEATLGQAALGALRIPPAQRQLIVQGLGAARDIAQGKRVDQALFQRAQQLLPPDARRALAVGIAVAQGQQLQRAVTKAVDPQLLTRLHGIGGRVTQGNPVLGAGARLLRGPAQRTGFTIGAGLLAHRSRAIDVRAVRAKLVPDQRVGFDLAVAAYRGLGRKRLRRPSATMKAPQRLGYYITAGLTAVPRKRRVAVARVVARDPGASKGASAAIAQAPVPADPTLLRLLRPDEPGFDDLFADANRWEDDQRDHFARDLWAPSETPVGAASRW